MSNGGKGSRPRPFAVSQKEYDNNWERIFGNKDEKSAKETNQAGQPSESREVVMQRLQPNTGR